MEATIPTKVITITILASDIEETSYCNARDCAITRALRRVIGDDSIMHAGFEIQKLFTFRPNEYMVSPQDLNSRVCSMYAYCAEAGDPLWLDHVKEIPSDFTFDLEVPEHWVTPTNN